MAREVHIEKPKTFKTKYFGKFDPLKDTMVQVIDDEGKVIHPELMPKISDEELLKAYKLMCLSRQQDNWQNKYQRQGRLLSFLSSTGQEACEVAYGMLLRPGIDWFSSAYRNNAAWLASGIPMRNIMLYWAGNEKGSITPPNINVLPINIPIATQYSMATGLGFAEKFKGSDAVVVTTTGDGGTSEGEFYEAMNFGKLHEVPVVYCVENNQYAISTPSSLATKALNFAVKAIACNIRSIKVDGNDFFACYAVVAEAYDLARKGGGPSCIEFVTYRLGPHSSSDDPSIYRDPKEFEHQMSICPIQRLRKYLIANKLWSEDQQKALDDEQKTFVKAEFKYVEANNEVSIEEVFEHTFSDMSQNLKEQMAEVKSFYAEQGE